MICKGNKTEENKMIKLSLSLTNFLSYPIVWMLFLIPSCVFSDEELRRKCSQPFSCGDQHDLFYPFWIPGREYCGHPGLMLDCSEDFAELNISSVKFRILEVDYDSRIIRVARSDYILNNLCSQSTLDASFKDFFLPFAADTDLLTIYHECRKFNLTVVSSYVGERDCWGYKRNYYVTRNLSSPLLAGISGLYKFRVFCERNVSIPASRPMLNNLETTASPGNLKKVFEEGFKFELHRDCSVCVESGGACGYNQVSERFVCYCNDGPRNNMCGSGDIALSPGVKIGMFFVSGLLMVILIAGGVFCLVTIIVKKKKRSHDLKALIPLKHYSYPHIKRITKSFAEVVGKGGFGTVYRGRLCDGRMVAVKVLKESKANGEDFINEVASMSKTSHVNIVDLLGFCSEGSKRAILYEFVENGSLDRFISRNTSMNMDWTALYNIALGIARGLEYLHHGCKMRIVHFDIKPQNILLDENLCPKVSDFGLAKLCEKKESILSLLDTRGTIGYIAPEVFSRMYGRVSHKSDVYSYGMLVLEMIGARNKESVDQNSATNTSSSIYFPEWIYKDLERGDRGRLFENEISNDEEEIVRKITLVGLWCIQFSPSDRPTMDRVVEMMEGSLEALDVPPRPVLQIPTASLQESSTLSEDVSVYAEV